MIGGSGSLIGYFAAKMCSGREVGKRGRLPSWRFNIRRYRVWLHHWFLSLFGGLVILKYNNMFNATELAFLLGSCLGISLQGIRNYSDWKRVIFKEK